MSYRQVIIARKDLNMSPGKLAAQVSHASMAFLTTMIRENTQKHCLNLFPAKQLNKELMNSKNESLKKIIVEAYNNNEDFCYASFNKETEQFEKEEPKYAYHSEFLLEQGLYEEWIEGSFTKTVCEAKNKNQLLKAVQIAKELGLEEGKDFFLIKDNCYTELEPEEIDENGIGRCLTCIGFIPLPDEKAHLISKKYQLYK